jgi:hypothetical protein
VDVGYQQQYMRDLAEWQKKRRFFYVLIAIAPLSIIGLCLSAYYFRETACVSVYWAVVVVVILVTLTVAARTYIREAVNRPVAGSASPAAMDLEKSWWADLAPEELAIANGSGKMKPDFLALIGDLPDAYLVRRGPLVEGETCLYVFAPSGPWIFTIRDWNGDVVRQDGLWKDVPKRGEAIMYSQPPDAQWVRLKDALVEILNERHPELAGRIQGGVVFVDPKIHLFKDQIQGNTAAYGLAGAWARRLREAPPMDGLTLEMQLETLDALIAREKFPGEALDLSNSAEKLAERRYQEAVTELRGFVAGLVGERVDLQSPSR